MRVAFFDASFGIAGDMALAALIDAVIARADLRPPDFRRIGLNVRQGAPLTDIERMLGTIRPLQVDRGFGPQQIA